LTLPVYRYLGTGTYVGNSRSDEEMIYLLTPPPTPSPRRKRSKEDEPEDDSGRRSSNSQRSRRRRKPSDSDDSWKVGRFKINCSCSLKILGRVNLMALSLEF